MPVQFQVCHRSWVDSLCLVARVNEACALADRLVADFAFGRRRIGSST
jgi:hypothetical protein